MVIDKGIYTYEGESSAFNRVVCSDMVLRNYSRLDGRDNILGEIIQGAILGGPIGIALTLLLDDHSQIDKEVAQRLKEKKDETKIVDFNLVSPHERLTIANQSIFCKVYQIRTITRHTMPSTRKNVPAIKIICDESMKIWISDDIPFGFVKSEGSQVLNFGTMGSEQYTTRN